MPTKRKHLDSPGVFGQYIGAVDRAKQKAEKVRNTDNFITRKFYNGAPLTAKEKKQREANIASAYFSQAPTISNLYNGVTHWINSKLMPSADKVLVEPNTGVVPTPNSLGSKLRYFPKAVAAAKNIASNKKLSLKNVLNWSDKEWDTQYYNAILKGDFGKVQKLRNLHFHAKSGVKPKSLYHGTDEMNLTYFDPGAESKTWVGSGGTTFLTPDPNLGNVYKHMGLNIPGGHDGRLYRMYAAYKNPKVVDYKGASFNGWGKIGHYNDPLESTPLRLMNGKHPYFGNDVGFVKKGKILGTPIRKGKTTYTQRVPYGDVDWQKQQVAGWTADEAAKAMAEGYDAAILKNVDEGFGVVADDVAIRDSRLLKSADAITRDDKGRIIPLSKRDNFSIRDFRYGLIPLLLGASGYGYYKANNSRQAYRAGGTIHIKPENRGKFNALKKRTGKTTEELTHSKNPLTRKRAIFAQNARKWNHKKK